MQLDGQKSIRTALTAITASLLGSTTGAAADLGTVDSSVLVYSEKGRVKAAEGVIDWARQLSESRLVALRLTLDALTGASPNGATPSSQVQTFTGPSGGSSYVAPAGEIPLDNTFSDQRAALDGSLRESLDRITFLNVGGHLSNEHDYAWAAGRFRHPESVRIVSATGCVHVPYRIQPRNLARSKENSSAILAA